MDEKAGVAERLHAQRTGELVARDLDRVWRKMANGEIGLMDFLLSKDGPETFIADFDEAIFKSLVDKGLLQLPRGVGGNWMRAVRTSFRVAPAVRDRILADADRYFGVDDESRRQRRRLAETFLKSRAAF